MIKTRDSVPSVYYNRSRDFQVIGKIFDIVLNYTKTCSDLVGHAIISDDSDDELLSLVASTLGFKQKHKYKVNQLRAICSCLVSCLKQKGSLASIRQAINSLLYAEGITRECSISVDHDNSTLQVFVSNDLKDINIFNDLLDYILPAGMSCEVIKIELSESDINSRVAIHTEVNTSTLVNRIHNTAVVGKYEGETDEVQPADVNEQFIAREDSGAVPKYEKPDKVE